MKKIWAHCGLIGSVSHPTDPRFIFLALDCAIAIVILKR